jgi:AbrB family looped-hinge helix DNA binding protein
VAIFHRTSLQLKEDAMATTKLSEKGQVVIPKKVRASHGWEPGVQFLIEETNDGIKLKPLRPVAKCAIKDVLGCLNYRGPRKTLKAMDAAIAKGVKEAYDRA